jgi:hypothetical protein
MSVVTEILSLRQDQLSSVARLIASLEWQKSAEDKGHILYRGYAVNEAADLVLLNVAAHCAEPLREAPAIPEKRRSLLPSRRRSRRCEPPQLRQVVHGAIPLSR